MPRIGAEAPKEFRLFKWGYNPTEKGPLYLTKQGAEDILKRYQRGGRVRSANLQHSPKDPDVKPQDKYTIANYRMELRDDGIWATDIQWIEEIAKEIKEGKWPFFSPEVLNTPLGIVRAITAFALTGDPAINNLTPLNLSEHENEMMEPMIPNEGLMTKVRPMKDIQNSLSSLMKACQMAMDHYREGSIYEMAQKMTMDLPEWLEQIGRMIEEADPEGQTEMDASNKMSDGNQGHEMPPMEPKGHEMPPMEPKGHEMMDMNEYSTVIDLCKKITGKTNPDEIKGKLRALNRNSELISSELSVAKKSEIQLLVEKGILEHKIPTSEKEEFLKMSQKEIVTYLSNTRPRLEERILEKSNPPVGKPNQDQEEYVNDAASVLARAFGGKK